MKTFKLIRQQKKTIAHNISFEGFCFYWITKTHMFKQQCVLYANLSKLSEYIKYRNNLKIQVHYCQFKLDSNTLHMNLVDHTHTQNS